MKVKEFNDRLNAWTLFYAAHLATGASTVTAALRADTAMTTWLNQRKDMLETVQLEPGIGDHQTW